MTMLAALTVAMRYADEAHLEVRVYQRAGKFRVELRRVAGGDWFRAP